MKIIDFEKKGNVVRFYLGEKTPDWGWVNKDYKDLNGKTPDWLAPNESYYGDDWDDKPYESNAGRVYGEFIKGYHDIAFDFDDVVLEPGDCDYADWGSGYSKDDMVAKKVPCIIVVPKELALKEPCWDNTFNKWIGSADIKKYYFGDDLPSDLS